MFRRICIIFRSLILLFCQTYKVTKQCNFSKVEGLRLPEDDAYGSKRVGVLTIYTYIYTHTRTHTQ